MGQPIHIGHIIQEELRTQGRTVTWLAKQLNLHRRACYRIFDSYSIDTQLLLRISELLGRDFFTEYSAILSTKEV
ncbi:MAG: XRE family transcriptional regulator [Bacteroidales bacterium]|nr:XRE family transcriptional regulator [Bacteroidales bacterium]